PVNVFLNEEIQKEFRMHHITVQELMYIRVKYQRILWNMDIDCDNQIKQAQSNIPIPKDRFFEPTFSLSKEIEITKQTVNEKRAHKTGPKPATTAIKFAFDEKRSELVSMSTDLQVKKVTLKLQHERHPFCEFSIDYFRTQFKREHNGDSDIHLTAS
ncbi:hypothetical protein RFI_17881, partial [Reticulomyxa filosa]